MEGFSHIDPNVNAKPWKEQFSLGSKRVRFETRWHKHDDDTRVYIRAIQGNCPRPLANREVFKHVIEMLRGWTNVIDHSSSKQYLNKTLFNGLIAGGRGRNEGRQACYFSAAHTQNSKAVLNPKSWKPQIVRYVHQKRHARHDL